MKPQPQSTDDRLTMAEPEVENGTPVEEVPGSTAEIAVSTFSGSSVEGAAVNDQREDLTVFFSIGVIIDVLLVAAFLAWAIGQWRKTKK